MLAERDYRLFMLGYSASLAGSAMIPVALTFAVLNEGHCTACAANRSSRVRSKLSRTLIAVGPSACRAGRDQAAFVGVDDCLHAVSEAELLQDLGHVGLGCRFADH